MAGSIFGGSSAPSAPATNVFQPTGTGAQDANLQQLLTNNTGVFTGNNNPYNVYSPQMQQIFQQLFNNPGASGYNAASGVAGQGYGQVGQNSLNLNNLLSTTSQPALTGATSALNMGLDPQQALFSKLLQGVTDKSNVNNAAYGLTGQQAAGNTTQADSDFTLDWQNQELQRALAGLQGYNQTATSVGQTGTQAQNVGAAGAGSVLASGATPYATGQTIGANQNTALLQLLAELTGGVTGSQSTIQDLENYLNTGVTASSYGQQASLADYAAQVGGAASGAAGGMALGNQLAGLFNTQATPVNIGNSFASGSNMPWLTNTELGNSLPLSSGF